MSVPRMRIHGSAHLARKVADRLAGQDIPAKVAAPEIRYDAQFEGVLVYDPGRKKIVRWNVIRNVRK